MPKKPRRPCRMVGCPNLAEEGEQFCKEHKQTEAYEYNHYRRDPNSKKQYGNTWRRIRTKYAREHPLCEECLKSGIYSPVEEVHHKTPINDGGTHEISNLISLCRSCHMKAHVLLGTRTPHKG